MWLIRGGLVVLCATVFCCCKPAYAQVDSPSARQARQALSELQQRLEPQAQWREWLYALRVDDVRYELCAGLDADALRLTIAADQVEKAGTQHGEVFPRLAAALKARAAELETLPLEKLADACNEAAEAKPDQTREPLAPAQQHLAQQLASLQQRLPDAAREGTRWNQYLQWSRTQELLHDKPALTEAELTALETVWSNVPLVWDHPQAVEASLAVRMLIPIVRAELRRETPEQHATAWRTLARLVNEPQQTSEVMRLVADRESVGQYHPARSLRKAYEHPNAVLTVNSAWLRGQVARRIDEPFRVNGVYAGSRSTGNGRLTGNLDLLVQSASAATKLTLDLDAISRTSSTGGRDGVQVNSQATTTIRAQKAIVWDAHGWSLKPATAQASSNVQFGSINAGGGRIRRNTAQGEVAASRGQAQADAAAEAERSASARLDEEAGKLAASLNQSWQIHFKDPWLRSTTLVPRIRVRSEKDRVHWEGHLTPLRSTSAIAPPPDFTITGDVTLQIATSAIEEHTAALWGKTQQTSNEFSRELARLTGSHTPAATAEDDMTMTFAARPCTVALNDGVASLTLHLEEFSAAGVRYPALSIAVEYGIKQQAAGLVLERQSLPQVRFMSGSNSGRQQTLRLAVQRKVGRLFDEQMEWRQISLTAPNATTPTNFDVQSLQIDEGWLQLALSAAKTATAEP